MFASCAIYKVTNISLGNSEVSCLVHSISIVYRIYFIATIDLKAYTFAYETVNWSFVNNESRISLKSCFHSLSYMVNGAYYHRSN